MDCVIMLNKSSLVLTMIELLEGENNDKDYQTIVNLVSKNLTDNENRKIIRTNLINKNKKVFRQLSLDMFNHNINVVPVKSKTPWSSFVNNELEGDHIYFSEDTKKYKKEFLNNLINDRLLEFTTTTFN